MENRTPKTPASASSFYQTSEEGGAVDQNIVGLLEIEVSLTLTLYHCSPRRSACYCPNLLLSHYPLPNTCARNKMTTRSFKRDRSSYSKFISWLPSGTILNPLDLTGEDAIDYEPRCRKKSRIINLSGDDRIQSDIVPSKISHLIPTVLVDVVSLTRMQSQPPV